MAKDKPLEGNLARETYKEINLFMASEKRFDNQNEVEPISGFFRKNPYDWTAFKLEVKKKKFKLTVYQHVQHEGYCRVRLGLPMNS